MAFLAVRGVRALRCQRASLSRMNSQLLARSCITSMRSTTTTTASHKEIKIVSANDRAEHKTRVESIRPISPHFTIYKWPFAGLASGTQRATGFALVVAWSVAGLLALPVFPVTALPAVIEGIKAAPIVHGVVKGGLAFSFAYHGTKNTLITRQSNLTVPNVDALAKKAIAAGLISATAAIILL